jgi:glycine hydroxymethyltransferase
MVVNAANNDKDWAWINAVRDGRVMIDAVRPWSRALGTETVVVSDVRDPAHGGEMRAQLALQGPRSTEILLALLETDDPLRTTLTEMKRTEIVHGDWRAATLHNALATQASRWASKSSFIRPRARLVTC